MTNCELLLPAGSLEKLKTAVDFGADAVYIGGNQFGLRASAENFSLNEIEQGVRYAHCRSRRVFLTLNAFLHDADFHGLKDFIGAAQEFGVDALIISDLGVLSSVKRWWRGALHLSTQASALNHYAIEWWKGHGVDRVILGREATAHEASAIKKQLSPAEVELEMFIHGSMCMAYSGHCVISNFTQGRDSNRGGCAHSCRFKYQLETQEETLPNRVFMSSKDLWGISVLETLLRSGVDSLKVEGRMKSEFYVATVARVYRAAIDSILKRSEEFSTNMKAWQDELSQLPNRGYTIGSQLFPAKEDSIEGQRSEGQEKVLPKEKSLLGRVLARQGSDVFVEVRNRFEPDWPVSFMTPSGDVDLKGSFPLTVTGERPQKINPGTLLRIRCLDRRVARGALLKRHHQHHQKARLPEDREFLS